MRGAHNFHSQSSTNGGPRYCADLSAGFSLLSHGVLQFHFLKRRAPVSWLRATCVYIYIYLYANAFACRGTLTRSWHPSTPTQAFHYNSKYSVNAIRITKRYDKEDFRNCAFFWVHDLSSFDPFFISFLGSIGYCVTDI